MTLCVCCRSFLGIDLNIFRAWIVLKKHLLFLGSELWEDDFSSMLDLVEVWEDRLYDENLSILQSQCQNSSGELGDVGNSGVHVVLAPPGVLGAWSIARMPCRVPRAANV